MISKKLIISEEERKEIKTLYGLIKEQEAAQKNPELTLRFIRHVWFRKI